MRTALFITLIFVGVCSARAQEQEKKLLDRLLKPDMTLQNDAQKKQFVAARSKLAKNARTNSFYVGERATEKGFWNRRKYPASEFSTEASRYSRTQANITPRIKLAKMDESYATGGYRDVHPAADARKSNQTSAFPGNRSFLVQGKSQKVLSAQKNRPMTIDEVRELLNKNK